MKPVNKLYHCTRYKHLESIMQQGLTLSPWGEGIYMCDKAEHAYGFMHFRAFDIEEIEHNIVGEGLVKIPTPKKDKYIYVIEINAKKLDWSKIDEGMDHNPAFFKGNVYTYEEIIKPECFSKIMEIEIETHTIMFETKVRKGELDDRNFKQGVILKILYK